MTGGWREDEPPSYEEVTRLKNILPQNIGKQISLAVSQVDEEEGTANNEASKFCSCSKRCWLRVFVGALILGVGILLTILGSYYFPICTGSMLPVFAGEWDQYCCCLWPVYPLWPDSPLHLWRDSKK